MVRQRRAWVLALIAALVGAIIVWTRREGPAAAAPPRAAQGPTPDALPRIGLDRLRAAHPAGTAGKRNVFEAAPPPAPPAPVPDPSTMTTPPVAVTEASPPPPPITLKYIGTVEDRRGMRVAVLLTDTSEILSGQTGEIVGQRYRIVKIGLESVDIQDVATDRVQRIPLRAK